MNGNQGLEALAALCQGETAAATNNDNSTQVNSTENGATVSAGAVLNHPQSPTAQQPTLQAGAAIQQATTAEGLARQQWQQAMAAAAAIGAGSAATANVPAPAPTANGLTTAQSLAILSAGALQQAALQQQQQQQQAAAQLQPPPQQPKPNLDPNAALAAMQQLAYFRYIQDQTTAAVGKFAAQNAAANMNPLLQSNPQAVALALAGHAQQLQQHFGDATGRQQVLPPAAAAPAANATGSQTESSSSSVSSMPPPQNQAGVASLPSTLSTAGIGAAPNAVARQPNAAPRQPKPAPRQHTAIAPLPKAVAVAADTSAAMPLAMPDANVGGVGVVLEDKKLQKRAANRRSAQLSRKRKKQFIEELKDENDELRRKEQILRSIPDLIVVFDSTGRLWFVSQSVSRFMSMSASELEGTSFWDRLCEDSVRLLKAAFMDSLAARTDDSDTAPLGSGIWELRLVDKDGSHKVVTLNGVVHFSGDRPECVCSIRPRDDPSMPSPKRKAMASEDGLKKNEEGSKAAEVETPSSMESDGGAHFQSLIRAKPQQSVISGSSGASGLVQKVKPAGGNGKRREAARISDGDSGSADSGSSDELGE
ncbi:expressed unknown protein [Seminavis robusta]|uniref:BZIP domain-containing protein n=1 Tax=Seminavis robusta TaxID=568900 RepID=A0A9N8H515_9STRA|nr:expressed unknown protein [Seminavis robusta]|eukprot:Sro63_g035930.1 n/a (593) ;mRNA; f:91551-93774